MAMSKAILGSAIKTAIEGLSENDKKDLQTIWETIADQFILHIQTNAIVTVAVGIPVATAGSPAAQTGATTAPGTGVIS